MVATKLQVVLSARDESQAAFNSLKGQMDGLKGQFEAHQATFKAMAIAGAAAFTAITAAVALTVKQTVEMEAAQSRLNHILKTSTQATNAQIQSLFEQARAQEKVGVVSASTTIAVQSQLATFDMQAESIEKLIPSLLDYIVAEKGINVSTQEAKELTNGLAQAMNGNFASLTRTGFVLSEYDRKMISTGTETERVEAITRVLDSTYKGFNRTARDTTEGALKVMKNEFRNLQIAIGEAFIPALNDILKVMTPLIEKAAKWAKENKELVKMIVLVTGASAGLVAILGALGLLMPGLITSVKSLTTALWFLSLHPAVVAFTALIAAIGLVTIALKNAEQDLGSFKNAWYVTVLQIYLWALEYMQKIQNLWNEMAQHIPYLAELSAVKMAKLRGEILDTELAMMRLIKSGVEEAKSLREANDAATEFEKILQKVNEQMEEMGESEAFSKQADAVKVIRNEIMDLYEDMKNIEQDYLKSTASEEESYREAIVKLIANTESQIIALRIERQKALEKEDLEEVQRIDKKIQDQEAIIQSYHDTELDLAKDIAAQKDYLAMNEMDRLTTDHTKKLLLIQKESLENQIATVQKMIELQTEHNLAMELIGSEKEAAINAEIEKTKTFREQLQEKLGSLRNWVADSVSEYERFVSRVNSLMSQIRSPAPVSVGGTMFGLPSYQHGTSYVPETGAYLLHKGEAVAPASRGGFVVNLNFGSNNLFTGNFREFSEGVGDAIIDKLKTNLRF